MVVFSDQPCSLSPPSDVAASGQSPTTPPSFEKVLAIETKGGYGQWLHGEAVAAGMVVAVDLSHRLGWIDDSSVRRVHAILKQANLPTAPPENMTMDMFKSVMTVMMIRERVDEGSTPKLIIPRGPLGNCVCTRDYDRNALDATLLKFCKS
ncbi:hypothetical protein K1719_012986 [Acacia pycnantha]|nr:hypothetical protein K1719_012986 [Acacia pycnantha]